MSGLAKLLIAFVLLIVPDIARAHPPAFGMTGFYGGLLHPLFVPLHALAILAMSLLIGQQARRWASVLGFAIGLAAGSIAIASAYAPTFAAHAVLSAGLLASALLAIGKPLPEFVTVVLAAATGYVIALDSPPETLSIQEAILMQLGTFLAATFLVGLIAAAAARLKREWQRIAIRIVGSWIAASAILVMASRIVR